MSGDRFGEVRSLMQGAPGVAEWERLCTLLDDPSDDESVGYASAHVERWPHEVRVLPHEWVEVALAHPADPRLCLVRTMHLGSWEPPLLERLCGAKGLAGVTRISAVRARLGSQGAVALARWAPTGLTHLSLEWCRIGDAGARALVRSERLGGLEELGLRGNRLGFEGVRELAKRAPEGLKVLDLRGNPLGARSASALARSARLGRLERLALDRERLTPGALEELATSVTLGSEARRGWGGQ